MKRRNKKEHVDVEAGWAVGWHRRRFKKLIQLPEFHGLVTLSRLANMLRFVYSVTVAVKGPGPESRRQRLNAFYLSGALLVETERTIEGVGRFFKAQPDYRALVKAVHSERFESVVKRFRRLRNESGFHFDQQPVGPALARIAGRNNEFEAFFTAFGTVSKDMYYDLGDQIAMELILGEDDLGEWFKEWLGLSAHVTNEVFAAIERFISGRLDELGFEMKATVGDKPLDHEETKRIAKEVGSRGSRRE